MIWQRIIELYRKACDNNEWAHEERFDHLTTAYRTACSLLELPELYVVNASFSTVAGQDYVEMDCDVYHVHSMIDQKTATKINPEPDGWRGRSRHYEAGQSRPPLGDPAWYSHKGSRIWLRDTPNDIRTILVSFKFHPPEINSLTDLTEHPITPPQYDMALVQLAAAFFFKIHPPANVDGMRDRQRAVDLEQDAIALLTGQKNPVAEEKLDTDHTIRQAGYSFSVLGR